MPFTNQMKSRETQLLFIYLAIDLVVLNLAILATGLRKRIWEHKNKMYPRSFTARYNVGELVYYEAFFDIGETIAREKQIKGGSRQKRLDLVNAFNPEWRDLYKDLD